MIKKLIVFSLIITGFLACNNDGSSGKMLRNGFSYQIYNANGGALPTPGQIVTLDFEIKDDKGKSLQNSRGDGNPVKPAMQIPATKNPENQSVPLIALMELLSVGDSAYVRVPIDSLPQTPPEFGETTYIDYVVKILNIEDEEAYKSRLNAEQEKKRAAGAIIAQAKEKETKEIFNKYLAGSLAGITKPLDGGLKVHIFEPSEGVKAKPGDNVSVNYYGYLKDGSSFDNSYKVGRPFNFTVGKGMVIKGWDLGIPEVPKGASAILEIPYALAYGENDSGPIPGKSDLYFHITVEDVIAN